MKKTTTLIILLAASILFLYPVQQASAGGHKDGGIVFAFLPPPPFLPFLDVTVRPDAPRGGHGHHPAYRDDRKGHRDGHWEWKKVWIPGKTEKVWIKGHPGRRGHWEKRHHPGHWEKQRVWVSHHDRRARHR